MQSWNAIRYACPQEFVRLLARALTSASGTPPVTAPQAGTPAPEQHVEAIVCAPWLAKSAASRAFAKIPWKK